MGKNQILLDFDADYEQEAISFLQLNETENGYLLCYSGGKDSDVLLHLARRSCVKFKAVYSVTGIDPPEVVKHIKKQKDITFLYPKKRFWQLIQEKGLPSRNKRYCCNDLKHDLTKDLEKIYRSILIGVRAEESLKRANRKRIENKTKKTKMLKPILYWKEWQIWEYIEKYKIEYCSLYDEGYSRIGCVICPFICQPNMRQININRQRNPLLFKIFEKCVRIYYDNKKISGCTFDEFLDRWYHGQNLYQKESKQTKLF